MKIAVSDRQTQHGKLLMQKSPRNAKVGKRLEPRLVELRHHQNFTLDLHLDEGRLITRLYEPECLIRCVDCRNPEGQQKSVVARDGLTFTAGCVE